MTTTPAFYAGVSFFYVLANQFFDVADKSGYIDFFAARFANADIAAAVNGNGRIVASASDADGSFVFIRGNTDCFACLRVCKVDRTFPVRIGVYMGQSKTFFTGVNFFIIIDVSGDFAVGSD